MGINCKHCVVIGGNESEWFRIFQGSILSLVYILLHIMEDKTACTGGNVFLAICPSMFLSPVKNIWT